MRTWFWGWRSEIVRDSFNQLSTDEFDACLAIVVCRSGANTFAHLGQIVGHYRGDAQQIWDRSADGGPTEGETYELKPLTRIHRVPDEVCGSIDKEGVDADHWAAVVHPAGHGLSANLEKRPGSGAVW